MAVIKVRLSEKDVTRLEKYGKVSDVATEAIRRYINDKETMLSTTSKKGNVDRLIKAFENAEFYSPDLADTVEKASMESRGNLTRNVDPLVDFYISLHH